MAGLAALAAKILGTAVVLAATIAPYSTTTPEKAIDFWADFYHVSSVDLYNTISCESGFDPTVTGDHGLARGIAQIRSDYFPSITNAEAYDPDWSVQWMAKQFAAGHAGWWTCYGDNKIVRVEA